MEFYLCSRCLLTKIFHLKISRFAYPDIPHDQIIFYIVRLRLLKACVAFDNSSEVLPSKLLGILFSTRNIMKFLLTHNRRKGWNNLGLGKFVNSCYMPNKSMLRNFSFPRLEQKYSTQDTLASQHV